LRSCLAPAAGRSLLQIRSGVQGNSPRLSAARIARGGEESQPRHLCSAGESRWAVGETPMGVGLKASLSPSAVGSLPRLGFFPTARESAESRRQFGCWQRCLVGHVAKFPGLGCEQVSATNLLGRAAKFATAQRGKHGSAW